VIWLSTEKQKPGFTLLGLFLVSMVISTIWAENTGRARISIRLILELYLLGRITFSVAKNRFKVQKLFDLYLYMFIYMGIWIFVTFLQSGRGVVPWFWVLDEEDACGPLMGMGVAFCLQYFLGESPGSKKKLALAGAIICTCGVVLSYARGAFNMMAAILILFVLKSKNKLKGILILGVTGVIIVVSASFFFPDNSFWNEMATSLEGTSSGTGHDRKVLWSIAWEEFKANPIVGVGPWNFGVVAGRYLPLVKDKGHYRVETIWGRALHNAYFQILSELGIIGIIIFTLLLVEFYKKNHLTREFWLASRTKAGEKLANIAHGIELAMVAFLMNAFFYDIIFFSWFWVLLILNRMAFLTVANNSAATNNS